VHAMHSPLINMHLLALYLQCVVHACIAHQHPNSCNSHGPTAPLRAGLPLPTPVWFQYNSTPGVPSSTPARQGRLHRNPFPSFRYKILFRCAPCCASIAHAMCFFRHASRAPLRVLWDPRSRTLSHIPCDTTFLQATSLDEGVPTSSRE
jgi:hypothetical protein